MLAGPARPGAAGGLAIWQPGNLAGFQVSTPPVPPGHRQLRRHDGAVSGANVPIREQSPDVLIALLGANPVAHCAAQDQQSDEQERVDANQKKDAQDAQPTRLLEDKANCDRHEEGERYFPHFVAPVFLFVFCALVRSVWGRAADRPRPQGRKGP